MSSMSSKPATTKPIALPGSRFWGPGPEVGLRILGKIRSETGVPVLTDIHTEGQAEVAGEVVDVLLSRPFFAGKLT